MILHHIHYLDLESVFRGEVIRYVFFLKLQIDDTVFEKIFFLDCFLNGQFCRTVGKNKMISASGDVMIL